jgi:hypothetical protein
MDVEGGNNIVPFYENFHTFLNRIPGRRLVSTITLEDSDSKAENRSEHVRKISETIE